MSIGFRSASTIGPAGSSSTNAPAPSGVAQSDLLVAYVAFDRASGTFASAPSGWNLIDQNDTNLDLGNRWYYKVAGASEPANYTWTFSTVITNGVVTLDYTGCDTVSPISDHSTSRVVTNSDPSNAVTVPANGWFLVFYGCYNTGATVTTPPAGLTNRATAANQVAYDSNAVLSGSQSATAVWSSNGGAAYAEAIALNPQTAAAPVTGAMGAIVSMFL